MTEQDREILVADFLTSLGYTASSMRAQQNDKTRPEYRISAGGGAIAFTTSGSIEFTCHPEERVEVFYDFGSIRKITSELDRLVRRAELRAEKATALALIIPALEKRFGRVERTGVTISFEAR
jgi:hypothetical protein